MIWWIEKSEWANVMEAAKDKPLMQVKTKTYTFGNIFRLFLMCAFPVHLWSIFMVLQDVGWIAERSHFVDAMSYTAYSLLFALAESMVIFIIVLLLSLLGARHWQGKRLVSAMTLIYFVTSLWAMAMQGYYYLGESISYLDQVIVNKVGFGGAVISQWVVLVELLALILVSLGLPLYLLGKYDWFERGVDVVIDRLATLTIFYLVIDVLGLALIFIRNAYTSQFWDFIFRIS